MLTHIEDTYRKYVTNRDFAYSFVDDDLERQYAGEEKFARIFTIFTGLRLFATFLALFIVIGTTVFRAMKAAFANPVHSLRDE